MTAEKVALTDAERERAARLALVAKIEALAEMGVREHWTPDSFRAGLRALLTADDIKALNAAKAEAWDEGFDKGDDYGYGLGRGDPLPADPNPYHPLPAQEES